MVPSQRPSDGLTCAVVYLPNKMERTLYLSVVPREGETIQFRDFSKPLHVVEVRYQMNPRNELNHIAIYVAE